MATLTEQLQISESTLNVPHSKPSWPPPPKHHIPLPFPYSQTTTDQSKHTWCLWTQGGHFLCTHHTPVSLGREGGGGRKEGRKEGTQWVHRIHHANIQGCPPPRCSYKDSQPFGRMRWTKQEGNGTQQLHPTQEPDTNPIPRNWPKRTQEHFIKQTTAILSSSNCTCWLGHVRTSFGPSHSRPARSTALSHEFFYKQTLLLPIINNHLHLCKTTQSHESKSSIHMLTTIHVYLKSSLCMNVNSGHHAPFH